jgi:hypothetical protein
MTARLLGGPLGRPVIQQNGECFHIVTSNSSVSETEYDELTTTVAANSQDIEYLGAGVYNVLHYGAVGDGAAIQAAIDALPSEGGKVVIPAGEWDIADGLVTSQANLILVGAGATGQSDTLGIGGTILNVASGEVGFTFGDGASSLFAGPLLRGLSFKAESGATGGVWLRRTNNWLMDNVICDGFSGASSYGFHSDGAGNVNQYGTFRDCSANNCKIGLELTESNGITIFGGIFDGNDNGGAVPADSTVGIRVSTGDTLKLFGTRIQYYDTGASLLGGAFHDLHGVRIEGCTTCLSITADYCSVFGGTFNNTIIGGGGTGIAVAAGADRTTLMPQYITAVATPINDGGTNTVSLHDRVFRLPNDGQLWIGDALLSRNSSGSFLINNNLYVKSNIVLDVDDEGDVLLWGSATDVYLQRSAANVLKTGDKFIADLGIGVGNSAAASAVGTLSKKMEVFDASGASIGFVPIYTTIT